LILSDNNKNKKDNLLDSFQAYFICLNSKA
jgi:hypothetical protein